MGKRESKEFKAPNKNFHSSSPPPFFVVVSLRRRKPRLFLFSLLMDLSWKKGGGFPNLKSD